MISATCGGTILSQLSAPSAMRLRTSREKIGRYLGLFLLVQHAHVHHGLVLAGVRAKQQIPAVVFSKKIKALATSPRCFRRKE
jgi:hypothetical protein